jgi:hypothetical protein
MLQEQVLAEDEQIADSLIQGAVPTRHDHAERRAWLHKRCKNRCDRCWIEARLGKLSARLRTWLDCRLEQEKW